MNTETNTKPRVRPTHELTTSTKTLMVVVGDRDYVRTVSGAFLGTVADCVSVGWIFRTL